MTSPWLWDAARAAGMVAWALLAMSTLLGLLVSTRALALSRGRAWATDLHRGLSGLAVAFVAVHVGAIVIDQYVPFSVVDALVPFASRWHPVWMAWGVVAMWLLIAVELTSLARRRLPLRVWKRVHLLSIPLFALATVHGLSAGTDSRKLVVILAAAAGAMAVAFLTSVRLVDQR